MNRLEIRQVAIASVTEFLNWIHFELSPDEIGVIESVYLDRQKTAPAPLPLEIAGDGRRLAGAYFTCLPGRLAMLGAVRTLSDCEDKGVLLVRTLSELLRKEFSAAQIQAAVGEQDDASQRILVAAGFQHLASVDQMWIDLRKDVESSRDSADAPPALTMKRGSELSASDSQAKRLNFGPSTDLDQRRFAELLEGTFEGSLDCPELNGIRHRDEILSSFLQGSNFSEVQGWEMVYDKGQAVGCLLMTEHPNCVSELAYMGLLPAARQQGFGRQIVLHAIRQSVKRGHVGVAVAVDVRNKPAIRTYASCGFQFHLRLKVYLHN